MLKEATVIMARCVDSKSPYGMRMEKNGDRWVCTWAFSIREAAAKKEGYDSRSVNGGIDIDDGYPGCPYCKAGGFVQCGECGKIGCYAGQSSMTCPHCGHKMEDFTDSDSFEIKSVAF